VIINTRWNIVAKEGLVILILSSYTQQDAFTQSKDNNCINIPSSKTFRTGSSFKIRVRKPQAFGRYMCVD
jgi:hypothetical protein